MNHSKDYQLDFSLNLLHQHQPTRGITMCRPTDEPIIRFKFKICRHCFTSSGDLGLWRKVNWVLNSELQQCSLPFKCNSTQVFTFFNQFYLYYESDNTTGMFRKSLLFKRSVVEKFFYEIDVRQKHSPTAVALQTERIQRIPFSIFCLQ